MSVITLHSPPRRRLVAHPEPAPQATSTPTAQSPTFAGFLIEFRQDHGGWSPTTWRGLSGVLRNLEAEFGQIPLDQITPRQIQAYLNRRRREGISAATSNRYLVCLKTMLKTAKVWGYLEVVPTDDLKVLKEQSRVPSALTEEELAALLEHCPEPLRTVVAIAADTGMRKSELLRLQWEDVDFDAGTVTVRQSKNRDYRVIPMTARVRELLAGLVRGRQTVLPVRDYSRPLAKAAKAAGIQHVHLHMLRHTFATRLRDRGVPLDRVMELMGHRSMAMVLRYAKARPQQLIAAVATLDAQAK